MTPFKEIFNHTALDWLTQTIGKHWHGYNHERMANAVLPKLPELEFKARIDAYAHGLLDTAPLPFTDIASLLQTTSAPVPTMGDGTHFGDFRWAILLRVVSLAGRGTPHLAYPALAQLTLQFSAEFDIRYFIQDDLDNALVFCQQLAHSHDWRHRRLASEGTRPRLPWGIGLPTLVDNPTPTLSILETLRFDPILSVRRSVANHWNDIAKNQPDLVTTTLARWHAEGVDTRLIKHALRSLLKEGNANALAIMDIKTTFAYRELSLQGQNRVAIGDNFCFRYGFVSEENAKVMVDFLVTFAGKKHARQKVFKGMAKTMQTSERVDAEGQISFRPVTVRTYYAGECTLTLLINGQKTKTIGFSLVDY